MEGQGKWIKKSGRPRNLEEGEYLEGQLLRIEAFNQTPVLVIKATEKEMERIWQCTQLRLQLGEEDVGKRIAIKYLGEATSKSGWKFRNHEVWVCELDRRGKEEVSD